MTAEGGQEGIALSRLPKQLFHDTKAFLHLFPTLQNSSRERKSHLQYSELEGTFIYLDAC